MSLFFLSITLVKDVSETVSSFTAPALLQYLTVSVDLSLSRLCVVGVATPSGAE